VSDAQIIALCHFISTFKHLQLNIDIFQQYRWLRRGLMRPFVESGTTSAFSVSWGSECYTDGKDRGSTECEVWLAPDHRRWARGCTGC